MATHRRQIVVDLPVQFGYAAHLLARWFVLMAVVGCCSILAQYFAGAALDAKDLSLTLQTAVWSFVGAGVLLIPVLVWDAIKMSHRFVGPIMRMKVVIRGIGEGKYQTVKLRKGDYWHDLAHDLNQMQERLKEREHTSVAGEKKLEFHARELVACGE